MQCPARISPPGCRGGSCKLDLSHPPAFNVNDVEREFAQRTWALPRHSHAPLPSPSPARSRKNSPRRSGGTTVRRECRRHCDDMATTPRFMASSLSI